MILRRLHERARSAPDALALVFNDRVFSNAGFVAAIEATRRFLAAAGAPERGVAVVLAPDNLSAWLLVLAARSRGLTTIVTRTLADSEALALRDVSCILRQEGGGRDLHAPGSYADAAVIDLPATLLSALAVDPAAPTLPLGPWGGHILYSSGTTGAYKKVLTSGAAEEARALDRVRVSGFGPHTVFHALGFALWTGIGLKSPIAVWTAGGAVIIDQTPDAAAKFLRYGPTYAQTTPEVLRPIVEAHAGAAPSERLTLRCGGGFVPLSLARQALERLTPRLRVGFSSTEISASIMQQPFGGAEDLSWLTPDRERRIEIVDEAGVECPPDIEGALRVQLTALDAEGYLDDPQATARAFSDGWFYPGDLAVRRGDGRIRILGRTVDVININGNKVTVGPIEATLQQALGVEEVCLFGGMGDDGVDELVVAVQTQSALTAEEIRARLGPSQIFGRVRVAVFKAFPRTTMGLAKTQRGELRRMVFPRG